MVQSVLFDFPLSFDFLETLTWKLDFETMSLRGRGQGTITCKNSRYERKIEEDKRFLNLVHLRYPGLVFALFIFLCRYCFCVSWGISVECKLWRTLHKIPLGFGTLWPGTDINQYR
jgi:hypothetical protein